MRRDHRRAEAYDRHTGRYGPELSAAFARFAAVRPGMRVLDVGCGPGGLTRALASITGAERVAAVDPSEDYAHACRERVSGAGYEDVDDAFFSFAAGAGVAAPSAGRSRSRAARRCARSSRDAPAIHQAHSA